MYILVNYSDYYGLSCFGKFDSHKEAYKHIADENKFEFYKVVKAPNDSDEFAQFIANSI